MPFSFSRRWNGGVEAVFLNIEPRWFSINVASKPNGMVEIDELYIDDPDMVEDIERGLVGDSVLTPAGVFGTDKTDCTYKIRKASERDKSIRRSGIAIQEHLSTWFIAMRDPKSFVTAIQPNALMLWGRAHELSGNTKTARVAYLEMFIRLEVIIKNTVSLQQFAHQQIGVREFVYLCRKLSLKLDEGVEVERIISFSPKVVAIGEA